MLIIDFVRLLYERLVQVPRRAARPRPWGQQGDLPALGAKRYIIPPALLLLVLAGLTVFLAFNHQTTVRETRSWVIHSHEVMETTQRTFSLTQDVESGQRGYLLYNDPRFLDNFDISRAALPAAMAKLRALVRDNPAQQKRVEALLALEQQRVNVSVLRVTLARQGRRNEALQTTYLAGKQAMDQARRAMTEVMSAEQALLAKRTVAEEQAQTLNLIVSLLVGGMAILGLGVMLAVMFRVNRGLAREIRARGEAEAARRDADALYRAIFENTADLLFVLDVSPEGEMTIAEVNPAVEKSTGLESERLLGRSVTRILPRGADDPMAALYRKALTGGQVVFRKNTDDLPGGVRVWESVLAPVRNDEGRIDRIVGSSRDVTEREQSEEQLRRAQRMEAVGHLTGGVAHDFNNLLQVIRGNLEMIAARVKGDEKTEQRVKNALHGANRAAQLTRQLLAFARRQPLEPKVVNLGRLVNDMTDLLRRTLGEAVEVETVVAGGLWNTLADPAQVESAVLNLAINARDAMPGGGRLTVELTNAVLDEAYTRRDADIQPGQYVLLAVSDTGQGMSPETLAHVFEPFFTTKGEEKGTGLGLSMVYGFVKQSNGHVQIYSELGHGTTVKIYLPRSRRKEEEAVAAPADETLQGRSEVILVVEDDELVRTAAVAMLRELGYACIHAHDGASAVSILEDGAKIDLLFTDVVMPGPVKSRDMAVRAQTLRPGLPVLFASGYTENAIVHHGRLDEGVHLLSKPYTREDLARRVRTLLNQARPVVLVVEDDALVRMAAIDMVDGLGFTPLQAADAQAALAILQSKAKVDILFTDIGLPGMRVPELAAKALKLRPKLRVVFASGYGEESDASQADGAVYLAKPYERDALAQVLAGEPTTASA